MLRNAFKSTGQVSKWKITVQVYGKGVEVNEVLLIFEALKDYYAFGALHGKDFRFRELRIKIRLELF